MWELKVEVGATSDIFKISKVGRNFGSEFCIIYIFIYFIACMSTKACRMMILQVGMWPSA